MNNSPKNQNIQAYQMAKQQNSLAKDKEMRRGSKLTRLEDKLEKLGII
jgi:hypothetical protein